MRSGLFTPIGTLLCALVSLTAMGCGRGSPSSTSRRLKTTATSAPVVPVDHLLPGELSASSQLAFGLAVPNGMTIERAFPDAIHLVGDVTVTGLTSYLRKQLALENPELVGQMLRFNHVHLPNQDRDREYSLDIAQHGRQVRLVLRDVTPAKTTPGLTDEERWRQAGLKPNGMPLNISDLR